MQPRGLIDYLNDEGSIRRKMPPALLMEAMPGSVTGHGPDNRSARAPLRAKKLDQRHRDRHTAPLIRFSEIDRENFGFSLM